MWITATPLVSRPAPWTRFRVSLSKWTSFCSPCVGRVHSSMVPAWMLRSFLPRVAWGEGCFEASPGCLPLPPLPDPCRLFSTNRGFAYWQLCLSRRPRGSASSGSALGAPRAHLQVVAPLMPFCSSSSCYYCLAPVTSLWQGSDWPSSSSCIRLHLLGRCQAAHWPFRASQLWLGGSGVPWSAWGRPVSGGLWAGQCHLQETVGVNCERNRHRRV